MSNYPIISLATRIRKPGESWGSALAMAFAMYRHPTKGYEAFKPTFRKQT